jgi:hypothetical protein
MKQEPCLDVCCIHTAGTQSSFSQVTLTKHRDRTIVVLQGLDLVVETSCLQPLLVEYGVLKPGGGSLGASMQAQTVYLGLRSLRLRIPA